MNEMRNYNTYLKGMEKGNKEKLFFLDHLNLNDFDTIIDFGCGKGDILKECGLLCNAKLIGIDLDDYMREIALKNVSSACPNHQIEMRITLTQEMLNEKTLVIFNSVLHEVEYYASVLVKLLKGTGCTIVVRDMYFNKNEIYPLPQEWLAKLVKYSQPKLLADFIEKYGMDTTKHMVHYLLKYTYVDNWQLELNENYFSFNYNLLHNIITKYIYEKRYALDYKVKQIKKDFKLNISNFTTHIQIIAKL